ncbi:FAD-binding protein [Viridibacterium curvum]|uniref:FAD-binding PCMH-type domain-containing protein n=1 Tax=Viridibacterium curvum TaxID=1101404 RepID=A0ABP9QKR8_9RHOO
MNAPQSFINDVSGLNPVPVWVVSTPTSIEEVQEAVSRTAVPISVGGGHFSMGGQTASQGSLHLDMRQLNKVLFFAPQEKILRVQAGIRWCDIQKFIDPHGLSVQIMQTYANFTVGGSLSVNAHGRYVGLGPLILSVRKLRLVLAEGEVVDASPTHNEHIFNAVIGGYGAIGIIVEAELQLVDNCRVERRVSEMRVDQYAEWFGRNVRNAPGSVFHHADIHPPHFGRVRAVTWSETKRPVTVPHRLQPYRANHRLLRYAQQAVAATPLGKWRRKHLIDPLAVGRPVHWRNYEAGHDVAVLDRYVRKQQTWLMQEYFVPARRLDEFVPKMAEVLQRFKADVLSISIQHAAADSGSLMAWARGETFALVLCYKQPVVSSALAATAVWTRELIDAVLSVGGTYYLPYQPHATLEQFHQAYPRARELFALKRDLDPDYRLRNLLWDKYYAPGLRGVVETPEPSPSLFRRVYADVGTRDDFFRFLQSIFRLYPEARLHTLIRDACREHEDDASIYRSVQQRLSQIRPFLADLRFAWPALRQQKSEVLAQTLQLLGERRNISGYIEVGTTGRYISALRRRIRFRGEILLLADEAPGSTAADIMERGGVAKIGRHAPLDDHAPIPPDLVRDNSVDMVSCYLGLNRINPADLSAFLASVHRVLRPGGLFVLREHDVTTPALDDLVSLAHTVSNLGRGESWEHNLDEPRHFRAISDWVQRLDAAGFGDTGARLRQQRDPTQNVLMAFTKRGLS